jgi:hypothetical protein
VNKNWQALSREAGIAAEHMAIGVTALGMANYAYPAYYGQAFFALTIGLERSAKLALLVDHAVRNAGAFPSESDIRRYGHDLTKLLGDAAKIATRLNIGELPSTPVHIAIVEILSEFANNVTRYYNLDVLTGAASAKASKDPIAQWHERVVQPLIKAHYKSRQRQKHEQGARLIENLAGAYSSVHHISESGNPLNNLYDASMQTAITAFVTPYVRVHVVQIIRFMSFLVSELGYEAQAQRLDDIPYLSEFFAIFKNDDKYVKSKKSWSIYPR